MVGLARLIRPQCVKSSGDSTGTDCGRQTVYARPTAAITPALVVVADPRRQPVLSLGEKIREMQASAEKYADAAKQLEVGAKHRTSKQAAARWPEAEFALQPE